MTLGFNQPKTADYSDFIYLLENDFDEMVELRSNLSAKVKEMTTQLKQLNVELATMLTVAGADKVGCEGYTVSLCEGRIIKKLNKLRLLELGVTAHIIEEATDESRGSPYIRVNKQKEGE